MAALDGIRVDGATRVELIDVTVEDVSSATRARGIGLESSSELRLERVHIRSIRGLSGAYGLQARSSDLVLTGPSDVRSVVAVGATAHGIDLSYSGGTMDNLAILGVRSDVESDFDAVGVKHDGVLPATLSRATLIGWPRAGVGTALLHSYAEDGDQPLRVEDVIFVEWSAGNMGNVALSGVMGTWRSAPVPNAVGIDDDRPGQDIFCAWDDADPLSLDVHLRPEVVEWINVRLDGRDIGAYAGTDEEQGGRQGEMGATPCDQF